MLWTGDATEAVDLAQESMARAVARWDTVERTDSPAAWVHVVARNLARSRWRRAQVRSRNRARVAEAAVAVEVDLDEALALRDALAALPARQREAMVLRHVAGLSPEETATAMRTSAQAVRNLTHRATQTLRAELAPVSEEPS